MDIRRAVEELSAQAADVRRGLASLWPADAPRCDHPHATMVQQEIEGHWFVTWQCDDCGMPDIVRPVTAEDLDRGHELPWFDRELTLRGLARLEQRKSVAAAFFGKAARR